jgi:hypothetical protein
MSRTYAGTAVFAALLAASVLVAQAQDKKSKPPKASNAPYMKLAEPWPDAEALSRRKEEAEKRPLFASDQPLVLTLTADFKAVNKDRTDNSASLYAGTIATGSGGAAIPVEFSSRGHFRLRQGSCSWVPLRVHFKKKDAAGTIFDGQSSLKLVTHCRDNDDFEQHVLREYLPYRIYGLVAPIAFRARLARITYVDAAGAKTMTVRYGMFIEDDGDVARRAQARSIDLPRTTFKELEPASLTTMSLFEYMIGNTDVSIIKVHNVKLMVNEQRVIVPVPYDFDFSGLVDTIYANPDPKLGIQSVRDRLYRGPCQADADVDPIIARFRAKKTDVLALYDSLPDLSAGYRKRAKSYLEEFFSSIERNELKRALAVGCVRGGGM